MRLWICPLKSKSLLRISIFFSDTNVSGSEILISFWSSKTDLSSGLYLSRSCCSILHGRFAARSNRTHRVVPFTQALPFLYKIKSREATTGDFKSCDHVWTIILSAYDGYSVT